MLDPFQTDDILVDLGPAVAADGAVYAYRASYLGRANTLPAGPTAPVVGIA